MENVGAPKPGWEPVESGARCAFCLLELDDPIRTSCFRCHALYHADCWDANGARCAVYACDPAAWSPARPPRRRPRLRPAAVPPVHMRPDRGIAGGLLLLILFAGFASVGARMLTTLSQRDRGEEGVPARFVSPRGDPAEGRGYLDLLQESRSFLYDIDRAGRLPTDPAARAGLLSRANVLSKKLRRALSVYERNEAEGREAIDMRNEWVSSLARIEQLRIELATPP